MTRINDGIYNDLSNADYHSSDAISKSMLDSINHGVAHYLWQKEAPKMEQDYLSLGTLVHCLVLEPAAFSERYAIMPKFDLRTKDGKTEKERFYLENGDKTIITEDDSEKARMMAMSVMAHPLSKNLLSKGVPELSVFKTDAESGLQFKVRPDWYDEETKTIVDLKTTSNFFDFRKSIYDYRYHVQQEFYKKVMNAQFGDGHKFYFIVVSTTLSCGQYPVDVICLNDLWSALGEKEMSENIESFKLLPTLTPQITEIDMPSWIVQKYQQEQRDDVIIPTTAW